MAKVLLEDVNKFYGDFVATKDMNLDIADREFVVLVGPSGCGKSTTLRMVAGLEDVSAGKIYIKDRDVTDLPPKDRRIAMVFQSYALYPHMNVYDNIAFGLKLAKHPKEEIDRRVQEAANILGLKEFLHRKPRQLSGGQRQRVALGRAIVRQPDVFLFDEPLSNLDAKLRVTMRTEIKKLHARLQATMIYVTHDQVEAMTMGDRIVVMRRGFVQQVGAPLELYNKPSNRFVAGFIGSPGMNFIPCTIVEDQDRLWVDTKEFKLPLPAEAAAKVKADGAREMTLGLRPEDFYDPRNWTPQGGENTEAAVETHINVVETLGKEIFLDVSIGQYTLTSIVAANTAAKAGEPIKLAANLEKIHLFKTVGDEAAVV